ncbi:MAG: hypothetical protein GY930_18665 [bacterium]|nr:hypothetical protein [bacterium]
MSAKEIESPVDKLGRLVEEAYLLFGKSSPHTGAIQTCGCCVGDAFEKEINATPLRELTAEQIAVHGQSAYQRSVDIRCMVPRVFELIASGDDPIGSTFQFYINWDAEGGDWRSWPEEEKELLQGLAEACFEIAFDWPKRPFCLRPGEVCAMLLALDMNLMERIKARFTSGDPVQIAGVAMLLRDREGWFISFDGYYDFQKCEEEVTQLIYREEAVKVLHSAARSTQDPGLSEALTYFASLAELHTAPYGESALPAPDWENV